MHNRNHRAVGIELVFVLAVTWVQLAVAQSQQKRATPPRPSLEMTVALSSNVKTEWDAFKTKDKKKYGELLADDFVAIEDDGQGTRRKAAAVEEAGRSLVNDYHLFALNVLP